MRRAWPALLVVLAALLLPGLASAQATQVAIDAPLLPLARPGAWTPIQVTIAATEPLTGQIRVDFGSSAVPAAVREYEVGRSSAKRIVVPVLTPSWVREVQVTVTRGRGRILATKKLVQSTGTSSVDALHVVLVGEDPLGLPMLREVTGGPVIGHPDCTDPRAVRVETLLAKQLPDTWFGWTGADLVVWRRPDPAQLSPEQQAALKGWVLSGGTLLVALGDTWRAWDGSPLGSLSGATPASIEPTRAIPSHLAFLTSTTLSEEAEPVPAVGLTPSGSATARMWADPEQTTPVLVDRWVGAGRVITMGWDPAAGELRGRIVRETMWRVLLGLAEAGSEPSMRPAAGPAFIPGSVDPACDEFGYGNQNALTQRAEWRSSVETALSAFERANPLPIGFVLIFGFIYLLLIGPVDYFVLRKLKKPMLTWVTFPALAIGFSVGAAILITFQKSGDTEVRCAELVDVFPEEQMARGSGWCAMWSSRRQDVRIAPGRGAGVVLPGGSSSIEDTIGDTQHLIEPTRASIGFRASQWAVTTWRDGWIDAVPGGLAVEVVDGEVVLSNRTGIDLSNAYVVHRRTAWSVGSLPSGETARVDAQQQGWTPDLLAASTGSGPWWETWRQLDDPWEEHVGRLEHHARTTPVLIGLARGGVAAPTPVDSDFKTAAHAFVRVPLTDLDPEVLP